MKAQSQNVERLVAYLLDGVSALPEEDLKSELGSWMGESSRFLAFVEAHRDKIRRKLRDAVEPEARGDVRAELETANLLLFDRRISLAFEAYGRDRRGPDFTVTFRAAHRFNLEVTRPRAREEADRAVATAHVLLGKLRQLPADAPNVLFVATGLASSSDELTATMRALKLRADRREERFFSGRGLTTAEFQTFHRRLALLLVADANGKGVHAWANPETRRSLPQGAAAACLACFGNARWPGSAGNANPPAWRATPPGGPSSEDG